MIKFKQFSSELSNDIHKTFEDIFEESFIKDFHSLSSDRDRMDFLIKLSMFLVKDMAAATRYIVKLEKILKIRSKSDEELDEIYTKSLSE